MKWMNSACLAAVALSAVATTPAIAELKFNELYVSAEDRNPGDEGHGRPFIELKSTTPNESLAGIWFLEINGDSIDAGIIDQAINLGALPAAQTGSNGLYLLRDEKVDGQDLVPPPHPETVVQYLSDIGSDFAGDGLKKSDNTTFLLVRDFTGSLNDDLDTIGGGGDGDGILDSTPWSEVLDALGIEDAGTPGFSYASAFGGAEFLNWDTGDDAFTWISSLGMWFAFDSADGEDDPSYYGPFFASDGDDYGLQDGTQPPVHIARQFYLTPGSENRQLVPEPSSAALALLALLCFGTGRWARD